MLTAGIMHNCIKTLLEKIEEESLECLCKLLSTVGKELEARGKDQIKVSCYKQGYETNYLLQYLINGGYL